MAKRKRLLRTMQPLLTAFIFYKLLLLHRDFLPIQVHSSKQNIHTRFTRHLIRARLVT